MGRSWGDHGEIGGDHGEIMGRAWGDYREIGGARLGLLVEPPEDGAARADARAVLGDRNMPAAALGEALRALGDVPGGRAVEGQRQARGRPSKVSGRHVEGRRRSAAGTWKAVEGRGRFERDDVRHALLAREKRGALAAPLEAAR